MGRHRKFKKRAFDSRFHVKKRRYREHKTNYHRRKRLIIQDNTKYAAPKNRFVVRFTNQDICCQIVRSTPNGDQIICAAYAHELRRFGLKVGYNNYAGAYCVGLLLARRVNEKLKLECEGNTEVDGEMYMVNEEEIGDGSRRPFKAILDVGLRRVTLGGNIFGALKGACDGGLYIPHNTRNFPGSTVQKNEAQRRTFDYDASKHRERIFGIHVANYMRMLQENDSEKYERHFSRYIKAGIQADTIESMYSSVHTAIRANPFKERDANELGHFKLRNERATKKPMPVKPKKLTREQRIANRKAKLAELGSVDLSTPFVSTSSTATVVSS